MNFCCGIVLFYPSVEEIKNIHHYLEVFERIYVFDNSEGEICSDHRNYFSNNQKIQYISYNENKGLSVAYNNLCEKAITDGYEYICLFDQDSKFHNKGINKIMNYIRNDSDKTVGIYAPNIIYKHKRREDIVESDLASGIEVEWVISSGSFINLSAYKKTEGFDENYFIDRVDLDYCLTVRGLGYKVVKLENVLLIQTLGEERRGIFKGVAEHSPVRHYYIFRNRLYFYFSKNMVTSGCYRKAITKSIHHIIQILLFEKEKFKKIRMMMLGWQDFRKRKMGKLSNYLYK